MTSSITSPIISIAAPPTASIILLTYNQEQFVEEALLSLLNQDMDNLEIVVSDDYSSDATWEKMQALTNRYQGSKKIILSRNAENIGIVSNYAAALKKSTGELILMAAGDDVSLPERCSKSIQFWLHHEKKYDLVATDAFDMAYDGTILDSKKNDDLETWTIKKWFERRPFLFGASHMVTRRLLDFAPLDGRLLYEDQCLVFRAILMGGAIRLPVNLVCHRRGGMSQQDFRFKIGHRRAEIIRELTQEITEAEQFFTDASATTEKSIVEHMTTKKIAQNNAIVALLKSNLSTKALLSFWSDASIPFGEKIRFSRYYLFYPCIVIAHVIRYSLRVFRKHWHSLFNGI